MAVFCAAYCLATTMNADKLQKQVGAAILRTRFRLWLSQSALAERANLSRTYMTKLETGKGNPSIKTLAALAKALGVNITELLGQAQQTEAPRPGDHGRLRLGSTIRKLRQNLGLSQAAFAKAAQINRTYLAGIEGGKRNPTLRNVARIAKGLNISVNELFSAL